MKLVPTPTVATFQKIFVFSLPLCDPYNNWGVVLKTFLPGLDLDHLESFRLDIGAVDRVAIAEDWLTEVDGLEESVSKALIVRGIGDEVGMMVGVPDRIALAAVVGGAAGVGDPVVGEDQFHPE